MGSYYGGLGGWYGGMGSYYGMGSWYGGLGYYGGLGGYGWYGGGMAGWWNPWWYGAYGWLAEPAGPALDPGFWELRSAVDRVVLPPPWEQVGALVSGWPRTLIVESSGVTTYGPDDPLASSLVAGPWRTPTGGIDDAPWNQENVLRVMSHVAPVPAAFWSRYGRPTLIPFAGRSQEMGAVADSVQPPA